MVDVPRSASPALADGLAQVTAITHMHTEWETTTIRLMADRIAVGIDQPDWVTRQQSELARIRRDLDRTVQRLVDLAGPEIEGMIAEAYARGHGTPDPGQAQSPSRAPTLAARVLNALRALWARLTGNAAREYQRAVNAGTTVPPTQRRQAVQRQMNRTADRGIPAGRDARGRHLAVVSQVTTVLQTAAGNASMDGYIDRLAAEGEHLVRVTRSPHPCPVCEPWEDRILSLAPSTRYPTLGAARAAGLWHPRCRHTIERWEPGLPRHPHAIDHRPGTYAEEQRQRQIERHIRDWKRREAAALDDVQRQLARRKVRQWQAAMRAHIAATGLQRSRQRERIDFGHSRPIRHALSA